MTEPRNAFCDTRRNDAMREQIRKVKAITDKPYGVDLLLPQVIPHSLN